MVEIPLTSGVMKRLTADDASEYHRAVQDNRDHLTALGDYVDEVGASVDDFRIRFGNESDQSLLMGIWRGDALVGHVALLHREPPKWGLGYWLAASATGQGLATEAVGAVIDYGHRHLRVEEVLAGVSHGNDKSVAVLTRLGFVEVADFDSYTRFGRSLV